MNKTEIYAKAANLNLTVKKNEGGKYYLEDRDGFALSPGAMSLEVLENWLDVQTHLKEKKREDKQ